MARGKHSQIPEPGIPWWQREAVRLRGYAVGTAVVGLIVLRDWVSEEEAGYILMAMAAVFGVYGIESSRAVTTPDEVVRKEVIPQVQDGTLPDLGEEAP